jgi:hypothetical protein
VPFLRFSGRPWLRRLFSNSNCTTALHTHSFGYKRHLTLFPQEDRRLVVDQLAAAVSEDAWPLVQARPLLLAATGREPTDSATVLEHGPADRLAAPTRRVGEPRTGADFGGERDRGSESVRGTGRKRVSFEFWDSGERQNWSVLGPVEAQSTESPTGPCNLEAEGRTFPVGRKLKTEILVQTLDPRSDRWSTPGVATQEGKF